jgi:hypothetical protein
MDNRPEINEDSQNNNMYPNLKEMLKNINF